MAVNDTNKNTSSLGRRIFWGTNVVLAVLLVVFLVVVANVLANKYNQHKDVSGGMTGHRLSDRTKKVLHKTGSIQITTVYTSNDPERNAKEYLPKLRDFCEEVSRFSKAVNVKHISSPEEQVMLRERVAAKVGSVTGTHKEAVDEGLALWGRLKEAVDAQQQEIERLAGGNSWLKNFSSLAGSAGQLSKLSKNLEGTTKDVKDAMEGLRYNDATTKITNFNGDAKRQLDELQSWAKDMDKLAKTLSDPNIEFAKITREKNKEIVTMLGRLAEVAGDPQDNSVPEDTAPVFKNYSTTAKALADLLSQESGRVQAFLKDNPGMNNHSKWAIPVDSGMVVMGANGAQSVTSMVLLPTILGDCSEAFAQVAQQLDSLPPGVAQDQLQGVVRQLRDVTARLKGQLKRWVVSSTAPFDEAANIDEASKKLLADLSGDAFKDLAKQMDDLGVKLKALPEQKMDEVGERLKQDNVIVVETEKQVRILPFDDVWPLVDRRTQQFKKEGEPPLRDFNGDSTIANAILDMQNDKPFATVIFVGYESQPPPQMRQFQPPMVGPLPMQGFQVLKDRLQRGNFAVKEWNLCPPETGPEQQAGAPKPVPEPPAPEKDTQPIYVFLPPAEPAMNPYMQQAPPKSFGEAELAKVREVLSKENARAVFLAVGIPKVPSDQPPLGYAFDRMLEDDWGIQVLHDYRIMRALPSAKQPGLYNFEPIEFQWLRLNYFTDHPIGKPLRSRRMLVGDACPVVKIKDVADVEVKPVLEVPVEAANMWAESNLEPIFKAVIEHKKDSAFAKSADVKNPPFSVILAAENKKTKAHIVVMGTGRSLISTGRGTQMDYLDRPVPRIEAEGGVRFSTDPAPMENAELLANTMYWLGDKPELIAAGPADVPFVGPITEASTNRLWALTLGWAAAVLVVGGVVMFIRRR